MIITDTEQIEHLANEVLGVQKKWLIALDGEDYRMLKKNASFLRAVRLEIANTDQNLSEALTAELSQLQEGDKTGLLMYVGCGKNADLTMAQLGAIHAAVPSDMSQVNCKTGICSDPAVPEGKVVILAFVAYR